MKDNTFYPQVSIKYWTNKYPGLEVGIDNCDHCNREMIANIPFITKDWVGFISSSCECNSGVTFSVAIPNGEATRTLFNRIINNF